MSGAKKTFKEIKRFGKDIGKKPWKGLDPSVGVDALEQTGMLFEPDIPVPEEPAIIPIPDENVAAVEARRRRAKSSRTGRDSTILTEGLGG